MSQSAQKRNSLYTDPGRNHLLHPEFYREIFARSKEPTAIIDPDGLYIEQNRAHFELLGYSDEELRGKSPATHLGQDTFAEVVRALNESGEYRGEVISRTKLGEIRHLELSAFTIRDVGGRTVCHVGIKRDITQRKRTERRLALQYALTRLLSQANDLRQAAKEILQITGETFEWEVGAFWRVDHSAQMLRCLESWMVPGVDVHDFEKQMRDFKFGEGEGLPGKIWGKGEPVWLQDIGEDDTSPLALVALENGLRGAFGFPVLLGSDVLGVIDFYSREIRAPDDDLLRMARSVGGQVGQFIKRKRAEEESAELLRRERTARSEAEQANRLKDEFLATLSHELRTPLNAVIGWSRMLSSGRLDAESATHALEVIERNAWSQKQIIEDILDVSRVITGKLQLNLGPVDLVSVVDGALDAVRPALEAKDIKIETIIDTGLKIVYGDAHRLQQVVWNLLSNAAKFTPSGGQVDVKVTQSSTSVEIQVCDTGPGIDSQFLPHVFERFRQADGSTTRMHGGLGLGLAIVRHLVELHGGSIKAQNRMDGPGAIFTIKLRLANEELQRVVDFGEEPEPEPPSLEQLRILVVDDELDTLDLITMELTQRGARVTGVTTAKEALTLLDKAKFDLLISDIGMPDADGYDLIKQVRLREMGQDRRIPAVALTAYARVQDRMRAVIAGYNTHVAKPVEASELVTVVAGLAGRLNKD